MIELTLDNVKPYLNTDKKKILENIHYARSLDLKWLKEGAEKDKTIVIVAGGPSLEQTWPLLKDFKKIVTINGAHDYLIERGIRPWAHVTTDARPEASRFVKHPKKWIKYYLAGKCDKKTFDNLKNNDVTLVQEKMDIGEPQDTVLIGGGTTAALRAINIFAVQGFRTFVFFGLDSCVTDKVHAYDSEHHYKNWMEVECRGRVFKCSPGMIHQANEVKDIYVKKHGDLLNLAFVGDGLISHMFRGNDGPIQLTRLRNAGAGNAA